MLFIITASLASFSFFGTSIMRMFSVVSLFFRYSASFFVSCLSLFCFCLFVSWKFLFTYTQTQILPSAVSNLLIRPSKHSSLLLHCLFLSFLKFHLRISIYPLAVHIIYVFVNIISILNMVILNSWLDDSSIPAMSRYGFNVWSVSSNCVLCLLTVPLPCLFFFFLIVVHDILGKSNSWEIGSSSFVVVQSVGRGRAYSTKVRSQSLSLYPRLWTSQILITLDGTGSLEEAVIAHFPFP